MKKGGEGMVYGLSKACSTFMASFALVSKYGIPPFDWQNAMARFEEIWVL